MKEPDNKHRDFDEPFAEGNRPVHPKKRYCTRADMSHFKLGGNSAGLKDLIECMVSAIVDDPKGVRIQEFKGGQSSLIEIEVSHGDVGLVIGREGKTANALRIIMSGAAAKLNRRAILNILEQKLP
jgi:hypothetical protein